MLLYAHVEPGQAPKMFVPTWGADAYERYEIPRYLDELKRIQQTDYVCWTPGFEYLAIAVELLRPSSHVVFEELGSTLFASIDKLEKLKRRFGLAVDLTAIDFVGIEIMPMMTWLAERLHHGYRVEHFPSLPERRPAAGRAIVSRCYQASSYALRTADELAHWIASSRFSVQGVFFARGNGDWTTTLLGNTVTLFDLDAFCRAMDSRGVTLLPLTRGRLDYGDALSCDEIFFIAHNLSAPELSTYNDLCARAGVAPLDVSSGQSATRLRAARELPARFANFLVGGTGGQSVNGADPFRIALDFHCDEIARGFYEHLDVAALSAADLARLEPVATLTSSVAHQAGFCYVCPVTGETGPSDKSTDGRRSELILLEDGRPLTRRHSVHADIRALGAGRYSHWGEQLYFSASDNSDPNANGRRYELRRLPSHA
jgi:hypothetical protein